MKTIFLFLSVALLGASCSQSFYYRPTADQPDKTELIYNQGVPSLRATVPNAEVATDLTSQGQSMLNLGVFVRNDGDSLVTFLPEGVRVSGFNAAGESVQGLIKVKSDPEFRAKILVEVPVNGAYAKFVFGAQQRRF